MTIHKEGYTILAVTTGLLIALNVLLYLFFPDSYTMRYLFAGLSVVFFLLILQFFRSPRRQIVTNERHVLAPADGKVVVIEEVTDPEYFQAPRRQISIFMSPINVHSNLHPVSGTVAYFRYHAGKYLVAWHPKSSLENERTTTVIRMANNVDILVRQIAGALAKRIVWYLKEGQQVQQGEELGFIKFGSRVDVLLPLDAEVKVQLQQKTKGGATIIAVLPERPAQ